MNSLNINKQYFGKTDWTSEEVQKEINEGLNLINKFDRSMVAFFGSHRAKQDSYCYRHCQKVAYELGKKNYAIISGGGPGIMQAANAGAMEARVPSIGLRAELLKGEKIHAPIFTDCIEFKFLFVRRFIMSIKSQALIFYPGGYGTLNELFEYAVLMQTNLVDKVPIVCVNRKFWHGLFEWLENNPLKQDFFNNEKDLKLLSFVDELDEILALIK